MVGRRREQAAEDVQSRYGQDVLYAARGQDVRSRYGQDVLYAARGQDVRSRPAKAGIHASKSMTGVIYFSGPSLCRKEILIQSEVFWITGFRLLPE